MQMSKDIQISMDVKGWIIGSIQLAFMEEYKKSMHPAEYFNDGI